MSHSPEVVTPRWQRRYADQEYRVAMFAGFRVGDLLPGTYAYERLKLAIAMQQTSHVFRRLLRQILDT